MTKNVPVRTSDHPAARRRQLVAAVVAAWVLAATGRAGAEPLKLNGLGYLEKRGLSVLVFSNAYNQMFGDSKVNGIELIQHGLRIGAGGDVRFGATPGQWDSIPVPLENARKLDPATGSIEATLKYPQYDDFEYTLRVEPRGDGFTVRVILPKPVPAKYVGRVGFNLEFLPAAYFHKTFLMDGQPGNFPLRPTGPMAKDDGDVAEAQPIVTGKKLVLAPEDAEKRITVTSSELPLSLHDGRNVAQNGWFVLRSLLPADKTGQVLEWTVDANVLPDWTRPPMIGYSQVGYLPGQQKVAVIELDRNDALAPAARLLKVSEDGATAEALSGATKMWGPYYRYNYASFDFSAAREPGIYMLEYNGQRSGAFRIDPKVYEDVWHPTLDVFIPEQMDHMAVQEAYRTWHGAAHMDDALQAPTDHVHFDNWYQGPETDTRFKSGEHIPGLAVGGWFDAGDFDIQTPSNYSAVLDLVETWDRFAPKRDETTVDEEHLRAELHKPDGVPDVVQQIEHGALQLLAQYKAIGHIVPGITDQTLDTYTHLGDGSTQTDNKQYDPAKRPDESDATTSGRKDDRWVFSGHSTPLNYAGAAALAGAARALEPYHKSLADECLAAATKIWADEHAHAPAFLKRGLGAGNNAEADELRAAVQLLVTTKEPQYAKRAEELMQGGNVAMQAQQALRAMPLMPESFKQHFDERVRAYAKSLKDRTAATQPVEAGPGGRRMPPAPANPYGVNVGVRNWAGNGGVIREAFNNYLLYKAYPDLFDRDAVFRGAAYLFGTHPAHNLSFVSGVGVRSKEVAYGNNRADFTFIPGGVVPGVLLVQPDFFENHEDWPFFWAENEYTISAASGYVLLGNALADLGREQK